MKGCARSCLGGLIGCLVAMAGFFLLFQRLGVDTDSAEPASIGLGLLATLSVSLFVGARTQLRDRGLLRDAISGISPTDGKWAGFSGTIRSSSPLTSPISGKRAVAFKYMVFTMAGSAKHRYRVRHYQGTALAASTISTNIGTYRLLAVPNFDISMTAVENVAAIRNARTYIESATFETKPTDGAKRRNNLEAEWTDDDGMLRHDQKGTDNVDLDDCLFEERIVEQGEKVCVLGLYSQTRGGIIPDLNWANQTRLIRGDGESGMGELTARATRYVVIGIVLAVLCAVIAGVVISNARAV